MAHLITSYEVGEQEFRDTVLHYGLPEQWLWEMPPPGTYVNKWGRGGGGGRGSGDAGRTQRGR
jgi:hypothetical protein